MGSYFSVGQWQELELQALIFRHMLAGAAVPPQLLHLVKNNSLLPNTSSPPPHPLLQHYYNNNNSHYHPSLQSGYWGMGSLDPEPGRCRRTDGKKWRCSRDVVAGHKYCERHMHRGRNRSRKPVEIPTPSAAGGVIKPNNGFAAATAAQPPSGPTYFELTGPSPSIDLFHLNQRASESRTVDKRGLFEPDNEASGDVGRSSGQVLRHFFDDWPRSLQKHDENGGSNPGPITSSSSPCPSISTPANPTSDFSLKLSTGNGDDHQAGHQELGGSVVVERGPRQSNWAGGGGWGTTSMGGGPLAEALRSSSSTSDSSPTSVLHQLPHLRP